MDNILELKAFVDERVDNLRSMGTNPDKRNIEIRAARRCALEILKDCSGVYDLLFPFVMLLTEELIEHGGYREALELLGKVQSHTGPTSICGDLYFKIACRNEILNWKIAAEAATRSIKCYKISYGMHGNIGKLLYTIATEAPFDKDGEAFHNYDSAMKAALSYCLSGIENKEAKTLGLAVLGWLSEGAEKPFPAKEVWVDTDFVEKGRYVLKELAKSRYEVIHYCNKKKTAPQTPTEIRQGSKSKFTPGQGSGK